jgi:predicted metal-dependent enzyme (double-stranded beta helix superfamily)
MLSTESMPAEISDFCQYCTQGLRGLQFEDCIRLVRQKLPGLLLNQALVAKLLKNILDGGGYPDPRTATMFDNELVLFVETNLFSLRMYLWGPGEYAGVHDHNSWGVIGTVSPGFEVINYRREDDCTREDYAWLVERERMALQPGEMAHTLPLNAGIHDTGNSTQNTIVTISVYGRPLGRGYLQGFNVADRRVYRILTPRRKKIYLASEALKSLRGP